MGQRPLFTGRQIATIAVAVGATIILAPVGVMAATGSLVNIADPSHPSHKAHVTSGGALEVSPHGTQTVAGTVKVGNLPAKQTVTGSVTANPGLPGTPFTRAGNYTQTHPLTVPAGKHFVIQTLSVFVVMPHSSSPTVEVDFSSGGSEGAIYVPVTRAFASTTTGDFFNGATDVTIYADPGSKIYMTAISPTGTEQAQSLSLSGYLAK